MNLVCTKCGEGFKSLALTAMLIDAGCYSSHDPLACDHTFEDTDLPKKEDKDADPNTEGEEQHCRGTGDATQRCPQTLDEAGDV